MKTVFKKTAVVVTTISAIFLSGCKDNEADNFIGQWSGVAETSVGNSNTVDKIDLNILSESDFVVVEENINSVYQGEGIRERVSDTNNKYNLIALSESELGEPGIGENPNNVIYTYNENNDTIIYKHSMIDGNHEVVLTRD